MNKTQNFSCKLLKIERLKQNKGQKEVCYGICVPSYLSKIEHNLVSPDEQILKELFLRLGIEFHCDAAFVTKYNTLIEQYFEQLSYGLDKSTYQELLPEDRRLSYSPLAIDWLLVKGFEKDSEAFRQLSHCWDGMSDKQLAYYYILHPLTKETEVQVIPLYLQAYRILNSSLSLLVLMQAYLISGQYDKVHECSDKCLSLALEEGNTYNLAGCYQLIGTAYACINAEALMFPYYIRAIHLLQNTYWKDELNLIYYNIGATLISSKKYEEALKYLNMVQEQNTFLLSHKKALALIRNSRKEEAAEPIHWMKQYLEQKEEDSTELVIERMMLAEVLYECKDHYLEEPEYITLLEGLIDILKKNRHKGYSIFYYDVLKDAYCKQRKYKKALKLYE